RPSLQVQGGLFRPRTEKLLVGGRDKSALVAGMDKQVRLVNECLLRAGQMDVPVMGLLCFVDADWPLIGGSFVVGGHGVLWPKRAFAQLVQPGLLEPARIEVIHRALAAAFPAA
ncbi:MAG: NERD domain-containing protein, partial [Angustibacter sp.]